MRRLGIGIALAVGMAADVTVFDRATVIDHATFEQPMLPSVGIRRVLVNGTIALRDGAPTGERAGMALRRTRHMPGRPPSTGTAATELTTPGLTLDVRQGARDVRARGTFRVKNAPGLGSIDMEEFGVLQTAAGWASFTGLARVGTRGTLAVTVIVDRSAVSADGPAVIVQIERRDPFAIAIAAPATP